MQQIVEGVISEIERVIFGKREEIRLALATFFAGGHLLIEDIPGVGKTSLAKAMAKVLNLDYNRIQFTSDLLPSDILGVNIFNVKESTFEFKKGAIFSQFLLADEINRATPKTQSALLEAMEEKQVTVDGKRYRLPEPFFVIATQNPREDIGVFELPSSQLDRFYITITLGYPAKEFEKMLIKSQNIPSLNDLEPKLSKEDITNLKIAVDEVNLSDAIVDYIYEIASISRSGLFKEGLSTRATLVLTKMAKAWAFLEGRDFVIPEDAQQVLPHILANRVEGKEERLNQFETAELILKSIRVD